MKGLGLAALLVAGVLGTGCRPGTGKALVYAPWEEGLVLQYENPRLPEADRREGRLQLRVSASTLRATGERIVQITATTLQGETETILSQKAGSVLQVQEKTNVCILPLGFPRTERWVDGDRLSWVMGRGAWGNTTLRLDDPSHRVGYWVETLSFRDSAFHRRTLYLPNIGEVETYDWQDGRWTCVSRLAARGWADEVPLHKS